MKKIVIYPDEMLQATGEVLQRKEPFYLHSVLWIIYGFTVFVTCFICFGKVDEVVRAKGIVRPVTNVSCVKCVVAGEIEEVFYKPGEFVKCGEKLLSVRGRNIEAKLNSIQLQLGEMNKNIHGLEMIVSAFEGDWPVVKADSKTICARYDAFIKEKNYKKAKVLRSYELLCLERKLPLNSTTQNKLEGMEFDYKMVQLELEEYCSTFISSIRQEYDKLCIEKENLLQEETQVREEIRNLVLVSPIDGFVQERSSLNPGDFVFVDQQILNIVPVTDGQCRIELNIPADKMGKLEEGQLVKLRFPAFPYSEFKGKKGALKIIQPDSLSSEAGLLFKAYADVESMELTDKKGRSYEIKPGYEVDARIVLENQSLLYFLLKKLDFTV